MPTRRRRLHVILGGTVLVTLAAAAAWPGGADALDHFRAGRWAEARTALDAPGEAAGEGEDLLLKAYLARRPDPALGVLEGAAQAFAPNTTVGVAARLDAAAIRFGQDRHREVLTLLEPLVADGGAAAPGRALVLAGLSRLALGDAGGAAAMLATVKPDDPAFTAARSALGDIALADRDAAKALRYYDNAANEARTGAGRWQALRLDGQEAEAERLRERLQGRDPGSVAILEINRRLRAEADDSAARRAQAPARPDTAAAAAQAARAGRYTLQLGAYSDRGLALDLLRRYGEPDRRPAHRHRARCPGPVPVQGAQRGLRQSGPGPQRGRPPATDPRHRRLRGRIRRLTPWADRARQPPQPTIRPRTPPRRA